MDIDDDILSSLRSGADWRTASEARQAIRAAARAAASTCFLQKSKIALAGWVGMVCAARRAERKNFAFFDPESPSGRS